MATWFLVPSLTSLRAEFDMLAPARDHASDGSIGDEAHKQSSSDHNIDDGPDQGTTPSEDSDSTPEVHAIDVDKDLNKSGWTMEKAVEIIVTRHRSGKDDRLQNVIFNRRIWSASWGWTAHDYTGSNPHDKHAHFSAKYTTAQENDTRPWGLLEEDDVAFDQAEKDFLTTNMKPVTDALQTGVQSDPEIRAAFTELVRLGVEAAADKGVFVDSGIRVIFLATYAYRDAISKASGGTGDPSYATLSEQDQKRARNARDTLIELGMVEPVAVPPAG